MTSSNRIEWLKEDEKERKKSRLGGVYMLSWNCATPIKGWYGVFNLERLEGSLCEFMPGLLHVLKVRH